MNEHLKCPECPHFWDTPNAEGKAGWCDKNEQFIDINMEKCNK